MNATILPIGLHVEIPDRLDVLADWFTGPFDSWWPIYCDSVRLRKLEPMILCGGIRLARAPYWGVLAREHTVVALSRRLGETHVTPLGFNETSKVSALTEYLSSPGFYSWAQGSRADSVVLQVRGMYGVFSIFR